MTINRDNDEELEAMKGVSWNISTGQPLKDERTLYLWHLDDNGIENDGSYTLDEYTQTSGGFGSGCASCVSLTSTQAVPVNLAENNAYTVEFWSSGKINSLSVSQSDVFTVSESKNTTASLSISNGSLSGYAASTENGWHYYAFVFGGNYSAAYCDGELVKYEAVSATLTASDNYLTISSDSANDGKYDEIRISNSARSADEISEYYKAAMNTKKFSETTGTVKVIAY